MADYRQMWRNVDEISAQADRQIARFNQSLDPRDEVIRGLVEAGQKALDHIYHGEIEDNLRAAIAAARKLVRQPYMGQIMAECDCPRRDECQRAGRCIAEVR